LEEIKVLIIDDEPLARERIKNLLENEVDIEVIDESGNGFEALSKIQEKKPELVFLDVRIPEMNGFEIIEQIDEENIPHIIFVSAHEKYALRAFEMHALDYLLKPFDENRFQQALCRARERIQIRKTGEITCRLKELIHNVKSEHKYLDRLVIKTEGRIFFIKTDEINWIEAAGNYITLYLDNEKYLMRETMNCMEARLDPGKFIRVHRSKIVNIERIKEIQSWFNGEHLIILDNGTELNLSRKYKEKMKEVFNSTF